MNRREFIIGSSAVSILPLRGADFINENPLRLGILSDIHISRPELIAIDPYAKACLKTGEVFERALRRFRRRGVDAIVIAGDLTEFGLISELEEVSRIWQKVFPGDKGADGRKVEKIFVSGNHDAIAWGWKSTWTGELWQGRDREEKWNCSIAKDPARAWKSVFGEDYEGLQIKKVRGYNFVMAHWQPADPAAGDWHSGAETPGIGEFVKKHRSELEGQAFFFVQHAHPKNTCLPFAACDRGAATKALGDFPWAIAISGHAHQPLTDERNVWQGKFTSIGAASLLDAGGRSWRENGSPYAKGVSTVAKMPYLDTHECRQGQYALLYPDRLVIERLDFNWNIPVGEDWVLPLPATGRETFGTKGGDIAAPKFAPKAQVSLRLEDDLFKVVIPAAVNGGRVYDYEVRVVVMADDYEAVVATKRILAPDYHLPKAKAGRSAEVWFAKSELPGKTNLRFEVRPYNCFNVSGPAIMLEKEI
jgi:predicted phosphodiesterase